MRNYSSVAVATTLAGGIDASVTTFDVASATGFPTAPFTLVLEPDTVYEEIVTVTARSGTTMTTVARAQESTSARSHSSGVAVKHMVTARDLQEPQDHMNASNDVHGIGSTLGNLVVGTKTSQTLENKNISGNSNSITNVPQSGVTDLVANLAAKAPLASPTFTGTVVLPSDTSVGSVTATELGYLDGVTSAIQTQLAAKQATITGAATTIDDTDLTPSRALVSDSSGKVAVSTATATELAILSGLTRTSAQLNRIDITSPLQATLDGKQAVDADLTAIAAVTDSGILVRTGAGTAAAKSIIAGNGIDVTNGSGTSSGDITIANELVTKTGMQTISLSSAASGTVSIDSTKGYTGWSSTPNVTAIARDSGGRYFTYLVSTPTTATAVIGIRHYEGTAVTVDVDVYWTAIGPA